MIRTVDFLTIVTKLPCSYVSERTARIITESYIGQEIQLMGGVPQGGSLVSILYFFYTKDVPMSNDENMNLIFMDDVTQIFQNFQNDRHQFAEETI